MTPDALWSAIDTQRLRVSHLLDDLTPAQWETPSLCDGWTVKDVAAHLTLQQLTLGPAVRAGLRHPGSLNHVIWASAHDRASLSTERLTAEIRGTVGSRRHNLGVTPLETLIDVVVHGQDIALPLGRELAVLPSAATTVADRVWWSRSTRMGRVKSKVFAQVDHQGLRFAATDADWSAGDGLEVHGPLLSIVLVLTGRPAGADSLSGPGASRLRDDPAVRGPWPRRRVRRGT
ncbi:maleylpyruvate isomerase family mycothiol-dependent enzyme [Nocardioides euryhalodurans]|uniref:Maleylpyruvate isomerase family mycothiol-dependent enzyme n=1 Tax=Nocardioides euryhalodurans TaxID=2518370 RepID=A0A4V1BDR4_9ACTN|nr:maleylpyruvate isomerase family mycothiol-dependent enzyme [Nocardioides euryhalodurans]QBR92032.1 maleylpyruvate isomerase family mycothiol-dependent enzyme [Nocardioides euryhalodurans]